MTSPFLQSQLDAHAARAATLPGAGIPWLARSRSRSVAAVAAAGLPSPRSERWKYTPLKSLESRAVPLAGAASGEVPVPDVSGPRAVFVDGAFRADLSRLDGAGDGIEFGSLAQALARGGEGLDGVLARHYEDGAQGFAQLNAALAADGALIRVAAGREAAAPLHLVFAGGAGDAAAWYARNVLLVGRDARLQVVIHHATGDGRVGNVLNQVLLHGGARLDTVRVQDGAAGALLVERTDARLGEGALLRQWSLDLGAALARHDVAVELVGAGAALESRGVFVPRGRQHHETALDVQHGARDTRCDLRWRGIADGRARGVFGGRIVVEAGVDGADARLENKNLLLSPHAEIDTRPVLEIHADEVKASHGATVGQLDESALFYLRSRGVPPDEARAMLTFAFCRGILDTLPWGGLRDTLVERLRAQLPLGTGTGPESGAAS
jgi:Fe-S cluster assembly protein SufD